MQRGNRYESIPKSNNYQNYPILFSERWFYGPRKIKMQELTFDSGFDSPKVSPGKRRGLMMHCVVCAIFNLLPLFILGRRGNHWAQWDHPTLSTTSVRDSYFEGWGYQNKWSLAKKIRNTSPPPFPPPSPVPQLLLLFRHFWQLKQHSWINWSWSQSHIYLLVSTLYWSLFFFSLEMRQTHRTLQIQKGLPETHLNT